jgi:hypothetical protein
VGDAVEQLVGWEVVDPLPEEVGEGDDDEQGDAGGAALCPEDAALRAEDSAE